MKRDRISNLPKSWRQGFEVARATSFLSNAPTESKKMGAALFASSTLLSVGYNIYDKTHPLYTDRNENGEEFCRNTHAELMAITKRKHLNNNGLIMYVYREIQSGVPAHSRPCKICMKILQEFGVKKIRYISKNGIFVEEKI